MCVRSCSARSRAPHRPDLIARPLAHRLAVWKGTARTTALMKTVAVVAGGLVCRSRVRDGGVAGWRYRAAPAPSSRPRSLLDLMPPWQRAQGMGCIDSVFDQGASVALCQRRAHIAGSPQRQQERAGLRRVVHASASSLGLAHSSWHPLVASPRRSAFSPLSARSDQGAACNDSCTSPVRRCMPLGSGGRGRMSGVGPPPHAGCSMLSGRQLQCSHLHVTEGPYGGAT